MIGNLFRSCYIVTCAILMMCFAGLGIAQEIADAQGYLTKATFLNNFSIYTEWPDKSIEQLQMCLFRSNPFGTSLEKASKKNIHGRIVMIRRVQNVEEAKSCHVIFIPATERNFYVPIADAIRRLPILTVTESQHLDERIGTIINIVEENGVVYFEINHQMAKEVGLSFSSKLLRLARIVR